MILFTEIFSVLLGQAIAALTANAYIASLFTPLLLITFSLFCGVTVPPPNIPKFWRVWLYRLNPLTYLVGGMVSTELHLQPVRCTAREFHIFSPPANQTCGEYAAAFLQSSAAMAKGYLDNPLATERCAYCPYRVGDDFIAQFGLSWDERWRDLGILAAFCGSTFLILMVAGT
jgi:ATP-binding cassette, subfamily G (WHITE), member 2, SNQ2